MPHAATVLLSYGINYNNLLADLNYNAGPRANLALLQITSLEHHSIHPSLLADILLERVISPDKVLAKTAVESFIFLRDKRPDFFGVEIIFKYVSEYLKKPDYEIAKNVFEILLGLSQKEAAFVTPIQIWEFLFEELRIEGRADKIVNLVNDFIKKYPTHPLFSVEEPQVKTWLGLLLNSEAPAFLEAYALVLIGALVNVPENINSLAQDLEIRKGLGKAMASGDFVLIHTSALLIDNLTFMNSITKGLFGTEYILDGMLSALYFNNLETVGMTLHFY